jgi:hypothetical protein
MDSLKVIVYFIMRGIVGYAMYGRYKAEGLRSMARLIHDNEPFSFTIDKERTVYVPVETNKKLKDELNMIADELEEQS